MLNNYIDSNLKNKDVRMMVKGRRVSDPLCEGLPSRIYIAAYPEPKTSYSIAKLISPNSRPQNSAGRIIKTVLLYRNLFELKRIEVSDFRVKTLISSKAEPFFEKLVIGCRLEPEEREVLKTYLKGDFRKAVGIYLQATLKNCGTYLAANLNAFEELLSLLVVMLYLAKLYVSSPRPAREFTLKLAAEVLPSYFGEGKGQGEQYVQPIEEITKNIYPALMEKLYRCLRPKMPRRHSALLTVLEKFEEFMTKIEKNPKLRKYLKESLLRSLES